MSFIERASGTLSRAFSERAFLIGIFIAALCARLAYVIAGDPPLSPDSYDWMRIAADVASGEGFGDAWRPPGYVFYLAGLTAVFGRSVLVFKVFNCILGGLTCVLLYLIGKRIFSPAVGKIASAMACFYPYLIAYSADVLSETFFTFLVALAILCIITAAQEPSRGNIVLCGIVMGITALTKSTMLPFFFIACGWIWWNSRRFTAGFFAGLLCLAAMAPWTLRNYFYYHSFIPVSPAWQSLWVSNNDEAMVLETMGETDAPPPGNWDWTPKRYPEILKLPRMASEAVFKREYQEWRGRNPEKFRFLVRRRLVHFWRLYPMMAFPKQKIAAMVTSGVYIPLAAIGLLLSWKRIKVTSLFIALFAVYTVIHLYFAVVIRYRVPIDPFIMLFAAFTLHYAHTRVHRPRVNY